MASFLLALRAAPDQPSTLARYTTGCGVLYMLIGLALYVGAGPLCDLVARLEGFVIRDVGLVRVAGMAVAIIGWFYVAGGRTGATSFSLATVVDRLLVPFFLVPLWAVGELPGTLALPFAVLDPMLALVAWGLWLRESERAP